MQPRVKICGITNLQDALWAVDCGADALGFIFHPKSSRYIPWRAAGEIIRKLPPFVSRVGVFVDLDVESIRQAVQESGITHLQLHGEEAPGYAAELGLPLIKAFRVADAQSLEKVKNYQVSAVLLDSFSLGAHGGTGKQFNWELARIARQNPTPIILAGGLTAENVREAIQFVEPYAVDVSSGVESSPGEKDPAKVARFITRAKGG